MRRSFRGRRLAAVTAVAAGLGLWFWTADPGLPDPSAFATVAERKAAFVDYLLPRVEAVNAEIRADRERLQEIRAQLGDNGDAGYFDERWLRELAEDYELDPPDEPGVDFADRLLRRVDVIPPSLVLAQAAEESGWGSSRFARHGNNLFGMRRYDGSGLVPKRRRRGASYTVAIYDSVRESVEAYVHNLNTKGSYRRLRSIRRGLRRRHQPLSGYALASGLEDYSQRGSDYVASIQAIISAGNLSRYDAAR
jgi:Bax protein